MLCKPTITVTANEFNTVFVYVDDALIADSSTFRRKRNFWNKLTQTCIPAKGFTPSKVKENPGMVTAMLTATGTNIGEHDLIVKL